ncbi:hypothetical protein BGZ65_007654 [Modicella reniformis]|uniref:Uncharacterized protein n=1 Tax=Modicella reniformis TaxID=1440133 RepID=A0A9P6INK2_9FUNG|nr:hypothetical protein BGZ65_007654 [Modicella reniformis]
MVNHASGSRGTSRAGSLEDGLTDLGPEADSQDVAEESRSAVRTRDRDRDRDRIQPSSHFYPAQCPTFTEILDCNGNPIEWSNSDSYTSSSASSIASHETTEEHDEDPDGSSAASIVERRRRRARMDRERLDHSIIGSHGRSRILSTGTAFEGVEYISEADSMLIDNHSYRSLKSSWFTNPNGESWSDDEGEEGPMRRRHAADTDDKDQETVFMRRGQPSLGVLQPSLQHQQGPNSGNGLYYIHGNVRNRYGPESARRRRIMTEMTDLLRREQEWERELERYDRELSASINASSGSTGRIQQRPTEEDVTPTSVPMASLGGVSTTPSSSVNTRSVARGEADVPSTPNTGSGYGASSSRVGSDTGQQTMGYTGQQTMGSSTSDQSGGLPGLGEGFMEYEQGHSHYHTQNVGFQGYQSNRVLGVDRTQNPPPQTDQHQPIPRQLSATSMNRAPPLLPAHPQMNEPIAHQIRRAHTSHMVNLQRRWEQQQLQRQSSNGLGGTQNGDQDMAQRYPRTATFVPPPSQQELRGHPYSSHMVGAPTAGLSNPMGPPVPVLRGSSRSSFRTSHETSGFQHFLLSGIVPPVNMTRDSVMGSSSTTTPSAMPPMNPTSATMLPSGTVPSSTSTAEAPPLDQSSTDQNQHYWRRRIRGNNSLYVNYEGGTLKPEERWRRGDKEMVGR